MTEEEKKAIEKIKELEKLTREESKERNLEETQKLYKEYADYYLILLNLIEKLQKENGKLKEKKLIDRAMIEDSISKGIVERDYIPKDKIKEKIKELEQQKDLFFEKTIIQGRIDLLKELLEEE